jgi:hypothetical protein
MDIRHLNSFVAGSGESTDESHLVQDNENVFTALVEQLAVEQCAVLGSIAALVETHLFGAFLHGHLLSQRITRHLGTTIRAIYFEGNNSQKDINSRSQ